MILLFGLNTQFSINTYFIAQSIQLSTYWSTMPPHFLILLILPFVHNEILTLFRFNSLIANNCWVMDTNNFTEIGMGNCLDYVYYINLGIGTPPVFSNFQIDTFHDQIWFSLNDSYVNNSETFQITNKTTGTFINKNFYSGQVGSDIVTVLQTNISTRSSIVWSDKTLDFSSFPHISGVLGLGNSPTPNFLENAAQTNQINSSVFALQMGGFGQPSVLYYSSLPSFLQDANVYVPVIGQQLWQVQVRSIIVNGFDYTKISSNKMIIDTSTSLLYLNTELYSTLIKKFFSSCSKNTNNSIYCNCQNYWPSIEIQFSQVSIEIQSDSYFRRVDNKCLLLLGKTLNDNSPMLIGGNILKDYIVTFDKQNQRIGFNGSLASVWPQFFLIFQFLMLIVISMALGFGIYLMYTIRYLKQEKIQKRQSKISKSKQKTKESKQKLLQLTTQFIEGSSN